MSGNCSGLNNMDSNPIINTISNLKMLRLSSYNRSVGAVVQVSCVKPLIVNGDPTVTCQTDLTWSSKPTCDYPPVRNNTLIISLASVCGFLVLITLISILISMARKVKKGGEDYKHMQNGRHYNSSSSISIDSRQAYTNEVEFYGPKGYPPGKRNDNVHMNPVTLPQNKSQFDVMETALPRLPSNTSLDAPSNLKKKKYDFEEFNVYALRQGRDPFLWRPVVTNMHFDN